jgi:hypothetical protein
MPGDRMYRSVLLCSVWVVAAVFLSRTAVAGEGHDSTYRLVAYLGGGGSLYVTSAGTPSGMQADVSKFGPAATFRVMWCPDHLLSVGLESGWTKLYSYETGAPDQGKVYLSQFPLYIVWSMKFFDAVNVLGGYGYSRVNTSLDYQGTVNVGTWSMGWVAACSYERPLTKTLGVAAELKWINAVESHDGALTLQAQLVYSFLEW